MSGMALERSVLERKERDELATIASALGLKAGARAKKETLIDQILKGSGVEQVVRGTSSAEPAAAAKPKARVIKSKALGAPSDDAIASNGSSAASTGTVAEAVGDAAPARAPRQARRNSGGTSTLFDPFASSEATDSSNSAKPVDEDFDRFERPERADRAERPERTDRSSRSGVVVRTPKELSDDGEEGPAPRGDRPERGERGDRQERAERTDRGDRPDRGERTDRGDRPDRGERFDRNRDRNRDRNGGGTNGDRNNGGQNPGNGAGGQSGTQAGGQGGKQPWAPKQQQDTWDAAGGKRNRRRRGRDRQQQQVSPERDAAAERISETYQGELIPISGILDLADQGFGYIRAKGYLPTADDVYVPVNRVRQFGLRKGDIVVGAHRPATPQEKFPAIVTVDTVNGHSPEVASLRPKFEDLTPLFPDVRLKLEQPGHQGNMVSRIVDLVSPIGKGQRGLIVSPPKAGKTTVMKQIATSIETNNPEVHLMVLLVDERPEEVTDMRRTVSGEVIASTFDKPSDEHTMIAELCLERAKRLVEEGRDVVIILDGITRLARAYNLAAPATGRIMSGGIDTGALYPPKKFFGAARNVEEGGSLTILATALVETGSTMDTVIFEEFKGTGNMELRLDRRLAEKRIYPAINVNESSTRHEELLFDRKELEVIYRLRRVLNGLAEDGSAAKGLELLMDRMKATRTNAEFLAELARTPAPGN